MLTRQKENNTPVLQEIVDTLATEYGPVEKIILFGSHARGEADEHSDIDLIVVKETSESFVSRLVNLPPLPVRTDVFVYTPREFTGMQKSKNPFIINALAHSRVLLPV